MPSTIICKQGDIYLIPYPFTDSSSSKKRPALVVSANWYNQEKDYCLFVPVTSVIHPALRPDEFRIRGTDRQTAGLISDSVVRCSILFTLDKQLIQKRLGHISRGTFNQILEIIVPRFFYD